MCGGDVEDAFRCIPVHPADILLQFFQLDGLYYGDTNLVFGMRASPIIFNTYAGLVGWICIHNYEIKCMNNYIDDYISIAKTRANSTVIFKMMKLPFARLGWPLKSSKLLPPTQQATHLGYEIDTHRMTITFPLQRKQELLTELQRWRASGSMPLREWSRMAGWLIWVCQTFPHIRPFVQPFFHKMRGKSYSPALIHISKAVKESIDNIRFMLQHWDGVKMLDPRSWGPEWTNSHVYVDATPSSIAAWYPEINSYSFQSLASPMSIELAEACAALTALTYLTQKSTINSGRLVIYSDNMLVTETLHAERAHSPDLNLYISNMALICFTNKIEIRSLYIPSENNEEADWLSRGEIGRFLAKHPYAQNVSQRPVTLFLSFPPPTRKH